MDLSKNDSHVTVSFVNDNESVLGRSDVVLIGSKPMLEGLLSIIG